MEKFKTKNCCVRKFHIYQDRWIPFIGERLECSAEENLEIQETSMQ